MSPEDHQDLASFGAATLFEADRRVRAMRPDIAPLFRPISLCGPAYTVLAAPGDNLAVHLALAEAPAGSVLVVATGAELRKGFWGEVMTEAALARGIRGLVTDGAVRDTRAIRDLDFPVFCAGVAIPGTEKNVCGSRNMEIQIGGVEVGPGDLIVADDDGVIVVPKASVSDLRLAAASRAQKEAGFITSLRQGALTVDLLKVR
jgi:4-hydroxy-4-methyl-2-oxoglutarate aldolase